LAWGVSLTDSARTLLAAGGSETKIYFISPSDCTVEVSQNLLKAGKKGKSKTSAINTLTFHPSQIDILFCNKLFFYGKIRAKSF